MDLPLRYLFSLHITPSKQPAYFTTGLSTTLVHTLPAVCLALPSVSLLLSNIMRQYRNIYLLSIDYAFRAGQNLPDKEFRYLRTVIVTAAVYWGLSSLLHYE